MKTVYLDTETTGLDPSRDELLEIAIVNDPGTALVDTLIRPQRCQQWRLAQRIHGIAPEDVRDAPALEDVLAEVVSAVTGARLVIYNADFDLGFLPNEVLIAAADIVCCMDAFAEEYGEYSEYLGEYRRQSLAIAADYVGHQWQGHGHHRALADALACRDVWRFITGSASYRAEVEARRMEVARRAEVTRHIAEALSRYDRQIAQSQADRWLAAQRRAHQVIQRFFRVRRRHATGCPYCRLIRLGLSWRWYSWVYPTASPPSATLPALRFRPYTGDWETFLTAWSRKTGSLTFHGFVRC